VLDVFLKDTVTGTTTIVSTTSSGGEVTGGSSYATAISTDGRYVAFWSNATNVVAGDTNGQTDAFVKDMLTGTTTRISTNSAGNQATGGQSYIAAISADGRYAAFYSTANNLVAGDTNGVGDSFIKDILTGTTTRISTDSSGNQALGGYSLVEGMSADGRYVAFRSAATNLVAGDTNGLQDIFVKDTATGVTTRVSTDSNGNQTTNGHSRRPIMSADGRYVSFFSNDSNLVAGDTNSTTDNFVKDMLTGETTRITISSAGIEQNDNGGVGSYAYARAISADGRFVVFDSLSTDLVNGDTNAQGDVFVRDRTRTGVQALAGIVVSNKASAKVTLDLAQRYRAELLDYRSKLGATTSRISTFVNTLQSSTINYKAASSRITDADIAEEAAKSIASGIRQQVASSLLGQANQAPQIGLQLLRNA
jgi:flagellin-like hook-associated protein FlgL